VHRFFYGDEFQGEHKLGMRNGEGELIFSNNSIYYGDWMNDSAHGFGKM
jgi:hypothetical protein